MAPVSALVSALMLPALALGAAIQPRGADIVGGTSAALGEFPYIVSLSNSNGHFCGGVLVNSRTVVTAGHCSVDTSASSVKVRAGTLTWASGGTQVGVSQIIVHPNYVVRSGGIPDFDVAVWHLSSPIAASSTIGYAKLTASGNDPASGSTVTTAGWGTTNENSNTLPARLLKVSVPVVSRTTCNSDYSGGVTNNMFCAGLTQGGKDSCSGDSGGPIVDASGTLIGVVSWGNGCAEAGFPGVYTRLGNFISFINANLA
ncbi:trypsin-like serine protease [Trichoderma arundinaceum]|uniref:Trypsin-like serine protease n=1 Tax=Trichoderma arundinaceum TaxID=490622 RepID=A0A395NV63_TRIAR|nr:trypsin-like serine protease [Trichoderma arundinaceum]